LWLFGGYSYNTSNGQVTCTGLYDACIRYNDLWNFIPQFDKWTKVYMTGVVPLGRSGHSANVIGENMYVFGGQAMLSNGQTYDLNDMWGFSFTYNTWQQLSPSGNAPSPRHFHSGVNMGDGIIIYGGSSNGVHVGDLYTFKAHVNSDTSESDSETSTSGLTASIVLNVLLCAATGVLVVLNYRHVAPPSGSSYTEMGSGKA